MSELSDKIRREFKKSDDVRDAGLTTPDYVERYDDIVYGDTDPAMQVLDVYRPKERQGETLPVIVSVHGGGWVYGDKELYQYYCMSLVQYGFAVVNFTYRLAPEHKFPAAIEDTNLVMQFVMEHAREYGFDTENIFAVGDSAGAHNLGIYAGICTSQKRAAEFPFDVPKNFKLRAIALNCGVYEIHKTKDEDNLDAQLMQEYLPGGGTPQEMDLVNVLRGITENYPPTLYMTCTGDFLQNQTPALQRTLLKNEVPQEFLYYRRKGSNLGHVFHLNMKLAIAHECNERECAFFRSWMNREA